MARLTSLYESSSSPLIALAEYDVGLDARLVEASEHELYNRPGNSRVGDFISGYLLGVEQPNDRFPLSYELLRCLEESVVHPTEREYAEHNLHFTISFMKAHTGQPPQASEGVYFEGFHVDSHPEITGTIELFRLLINLSPYPRIFRYARTDSYELARAGVKIGRSEFEPLILPPGIEETDIEIPGRTSTSIYALRFWASVVPHVGINKPAGSFLASFESLADFSRMRIVNS